MVRGSIIEALILSLDNSKIYKTYEQILALLIKYDFPMRWPDL